MADDNRGGRSGQNNRGNRNGKGGGGRKRNRGRNKKSNHPGKPFTGMLEMIGDKNFGFIREIDPALPKGDNDPFMPPPIIDKYNLRDGVMLEGTIKPGRKGSGATSGQ